MNNVYDVKTITEGELMEKLNESCIVFGKWTTPTPDNIITDNFHLNLSMKLKIELSGTNLVYSSHELDPAFTTDGRISGMISSYITSNMKWMMTKIGFVRTLYRMIIDHATFMKGGTFGERLWEVNRIIKQSFRMNSVEMFMTMLNTDWEKISILYFTELMNDVHAIDSQWQLFQEKFIIDEQMIERVVCHSYDDLYEWAKEHNQTDMMVILLRWKHERIGESEGGMEL